MRNGLSGFLAGALTAGVLLFGGAAAAAEIGAHTMKLASAGADGSPLAMGMAKFAEIVKAKSGGKIKVQLFTNGVLGGDVQMISALQGGIVEMTVLNAGLLASLDDSFVLVDLPFQFDTPREADAVMDGPVGKALLDKLSPKGLVGLGYWELGFRQLTNSRHPVASVEDIAGLKIRVVQSPIYIDLFNTLGANAVPLPFPEVYTALESRTVDGQENPAPSILTAKLNEVQKYLTLSNHMYNPQAVLIGAKFWNRLNEDERKLIQDAALEARDYERNVSREQAGKAVEELQSRGMVVNELAPAEIEKFRAKIQPVVEKFSQKVDPALLAQARAEIAKARAAQ
ncbi:TRAP transporter substrate-binding protein [Azospirillum picis]|uniref:Tripartite ATP-independent transporter DctP family solute receptor n=1 Tax=Azospirillum picis TaxID=488438 RepID=A0ABU0MUQ1_9PROT|nr:TRAP transporter substrate-binding protein [Azospirillum picis]MBP2299123.1 tripartite ATP-independent transporter DctP family solute receptor [Azospirillum picis]MDQ0537049.1 tripartite ATP-independent transporter DctP family solute receptor [Azospirillum picis]